MVMNQPIYTELNAECDLSEGAPYYNAGVILINLKYWREYKIQDKLLAYWKQKGSFSVDDQGCLNGILADSTLSLPLKYNVMKMVYTSNYKRYLCMQKPIGHITEKEFYEAKKHPVIVHFNGPALRPWMKWSGHPYTKAFRRAVYKNTPDFKLWQSKKPLSFLIKQYLWCKYICRILPNIY